MERTSVLKVIRSYIAGQVDPGVLYECRRCGRTLDPSTEECPDCGAAEIAQYHL